MHQGTWWKEHDYCRVAQRKQLPSVQARLKGRFRTSEVRGVLGRWVRCRCLPEGEDHQQHSDPWRLGEVEFKLRPQSTSWWALRQRLFPIDRLPDCLREPVNQWALGRSEEPQRSLCSCSRSQQLLRICNFLETWLFWCQHIGIHRGRWATWDVYWARAILQSSRKGCGSKEAHVQVQP